MLRVIDHVPDGFLDAKPEDLADILKGPTLMHLEGRIKTPLFVSTLLHGNEPTGVHAVQCLLKNYTTSKGLNLPRSLSLFVANVDAAKADLRRLDTQPDYNRVWPKGDDKTSPEALMMAEVVNIMKPLKPFASIDVHNNTGLNPHYGCVNKLDGPFLYLASLFSRTITYFLVPRGVQSLAFADLCPSVTIECGKAGDDWATEHTSRFLDAALHLSEFPTHSFPAHDANVFHTVARVFVDEGTSISFDGSDADMCFDQNIDHMNFAEVSEGTFWGLSTNGKLSLRVENEQGEDVSDQYFDFNGREVTLKRMVMPSMLTCDPVIVKQDCLCYLMERMEDVL